MDDTDTRGRLGVACLQLRLPELRQTIRLGSWDEVLGAIRALPDDVMVRLVERTFSEAEAEVLLPAFRMRGNWLTHPGPVTEPEVRQVLRELTVFAAQIGSETTPSELLVVTTGATRYRPNVAVDPTWQHAILAVHDFSRAHNPGFDCRIANAVVHDAHLSNQRAVRSFFANAYVGAVSGVDHPWSIPWRLACRGFLIEALYADGVAQVATRVL